MHKFYGKRKLQQHQQQLQYGEKNDSRQAAEDEREEEENRWMQKDKQFPLKRE